MKKSKLKKGEIDVEKCTMVSLIPARGGSKRIPRKNIKMMAGKPMIAWSIEASLKSKYVNRTFVSTEDPEIKEVAIKYGAEVINRPKEYATEIEGRQEYEHDGIIHNFKEALWDMGCKPEYLAFLYPTSPLRTGEQIDKAFELIVERNCTRIMTANKTTPERHYYIINKKGKTEKVEFQEPRYARSGDILIMRYRDINLGADVNYADFTLYIIDKEGVVDVNTPYDFAKAEYLLNKRIKGGGEK